MGIINDTLITGVDTLATAVDMVNTQVNVATQADSMDNELMTNFLLPFVISIALLISGWILNSLYQKYFAVRPRLVLKIAKPLYAQRFISYDDGHELSWAFIIQLKNNSQFTAYNIELLEAKRRSEKNIVDNFNAIKRVLVPNNHMDKHDQKEFEIKKTIYTDAQVLINIVEEGGDKVIMPGSKIANPEVVLMPKELNDIKLILRYQNEKGKTFYTKYRRFKNKETNIFCRFQPYFLLVKLK